MYASLMEAMCTCMYARRVVNIILASQISERHCIWHCICQERAHA